MHHITIIIVVFCTILVALLSKSPFELTIFWLVCIAPYYFVFNLQTVLLATFIYLVPFIGALFFVWGVLPEYTLMGDYYSSPDYGFVYAWWVSIKLLILIGLLQICILSISRSDAVHVLKKFGINGSLLPIFLMSLTTIPEMYRKAQQVVDARKARGMFVESRLIGKIRLIPILVMPVLVWSLRLAALRSDLWRQKNVLECLSKSSVKKIDFQLVDGGLVVVYITSVLIFYLRYY